MLLETMRPYDPEQPLIYTHIPKCAGSSVVRLLKHWFQNDYHKLNQDETQDILLPRVATRDNDGNWLPHVKVIHGHFNHGRGYGLPYFYPEINQYFTILRDPFDVLVSMYFFAKGRSREGKFWYRGAAVDLREVYPSVEHYVRSYPYWLFDHLPVDITLANYREKLAEKFVYIGVFEDLQTTVNHLAGMLGREPAELPHVNVSTYDEPIPEHLREQVYHDYPLLKRLHEFALETYRELPR